MNYTEFLQEAHETVSVALEMEHVPDFLIELKKRKLGTLPNAKVAITNAAEAVTTIVSNVQQNKYLFSILITAAMKKSLSPSQDIRIAQDLLPGGYSNRSLDQTQVTPFLKRHGYTSCAASGLESGRNFERPLAWDLQFPCNPRGAGNREAFLLLIDLIQKHHDVADLVVKSLLYVDAEGRGNEPTLVVPPLESNIDRIMLVLERHFKESSGQGKSRLPVLALYALYEQLVPELSRFNNSVLQPLQNHTTADLRSGSIGDVQLDRDGKPFEGIEVKSELPITPDMLRELKRKLESLSVNRYYVLTTYPGSFKPEDEEFLVELCREILDSTGCQVIVNGLNRSIRYYLRLLNDPSKVLGRYSLLLVEDESVRPDLIAKWNDILEQEYPNFSVQT
jgi:DNA (cytosine-5)-methyltransferase 1